MTFRPSTELLCPVTYTRAIKATADRGVDSLRSKLQGGNPAQEKYPACADDPAGNMTEAWAPEQIAKWDTNFDEHLGHMPTEAELDRVQTDLDQIQKWFAQAQGRTTPERGMHAKGDGAGNVVFEVSHNLPDELAHGPLVAGAELQGVARYSNGAGTEGADQNPDRRGLAFSVLDAAAQRWAFLGVSGAANFIGSTGQAALDGLYVEAYMAAHPGARGQVEGLSILMKRRVAEHGPKGIAESLRMVRQQKSTSNHGESLAATTFYSRVPYQLGRFAVMLRYVPKDTDLTVHAQGENALASDAEGRGPIRYAVQVVGYTNPKDTPVDNANLRWKNSDYITIGTLTVKPPETPEEQQALLDEVNAHHFGPWDRPESATPEDFEPVGNVGAVRRAAYARSRKNRAAEDGQPSGCPILKARG